MVSVEVESDISSPEMKKLYLGVAAQMGCEKLVELFFFGVSCLSHKAY